MNTMTGNLFKVRLSDIADVISGYAFPSSEFCDSGVPVIKISNIRVGYMDMADPQFASEEYLGKLNQKYVVRGGDILISLTGSHISQPNSVVGRVARYRSNLPFAFLNQRAGKIIVRQPDRCDPEYLYWLLVQPEVREKIAAMAHGAANQANVSPSQVGSLEISLPTINTQRRIASILSAYDDLIENNTRRIAILEEMVQRIYEEWFVHFRFPGHEKVRMVESELGLVPEGWAVATLGDVVRKSGRKFVETSDAHLPLVDLARIPRRSSALSEIGHADEISTSRMVFKERQILFGAIRPNFHKVLFAPFDGVTNVSVHILEPISSESLCLSHALLFSDRTVAWTVQHSGGMKMPTINWDVMQKMPVIVPTPEVTKLHEQQARPMLDLISVLVRKNFPLRATRDLLLPKLVSGELDVSHLPEPEAMVKWA